MAATKTLIVNAPARGGTIYGIVERMSDGAYFNASSGSFGTATSSVFAPFSEHVLVKGQFVYTDSRAVWADGKYTWTGYWQNTGTPIPASDFIIASAQFEILDDTELVMSALDALVSSEGLSTRAAISSLDAHLGLVQSDLMQGVVAGRIVIPTATQTASDALALYTKTHFDGTFYVGAAWSSYASQPVWLTAKKRAASDYAVLWTVQGTVANVSSMAAVFSLHPTSHNDQEAGRYYSFEVQFRAANGSTIKNAMTGALEYMSTLKV